MRSLWGHCEVWWHHDKDSLEKVLMCNVQWRSHDAFNRTVGKLSVMNFIIEVFTGSLGSEEPRSNPGLKSYRVQILLSVISSGLFLLPRVCMSTCLKRVDQLWSCGQNHRRRKRNVNVNWHEEQVKGGKTSWRVSCLLLFWQVLTSSDKGPETFFRKICRL